MKGDPKVIEFLNDALKNELTAINQYFLHSKMLANWGISKLAKYEYEESIDEMKHADKLADRILFLDGLPNFQLLGRLKIGETVEEILRADLALETRRSRSSRKASPIARASAITVRATCSPISSRARKSMSTRSRRSST